MTMNVLVYEYLTAGGFDETSSSGCADADLLAQGMAMRNAVLADLRALPHVRVAAACGHDDDTRLPGEYAMVRPRAGESAPEFITRVAGGFDKVWVVAPECDGTLAALRDAVDAHRWVGCGATAIGLASSKIATRRRLRSCGIEVPGDLDLGALHPGAWVVKPDDGAGSQFTRRHAGLEHALADLHERRDARQTATIEQWVEGVPMSLSLMASANGIEVLSINRQRIELDAAGWVRYCGLECGVESVSGETGRTLGELARRIGSAIAGLRGFVGVDFVRTPQGRNVVLEINPRLTCAYVGLSARLGRNLAAEALATCANGEVSLANA